MKNSEIYESKFVKNLFEEMSKTYGVTNYLTSFGFTKRWRRQCIELIDIKPGMTVCDLMTGQGESWVDIGHKLHQQGQIVGLDFSSEMCLRAKKQVPQYASIDINVLHEDVLNNSIPSESVDCVVSTFGLKTFSDEDKYGVMSQINRILKPGGIFSLLEISVPQNQFLRTPYIWYLSCCIPFAGKACLGNPDNYRLLNMYAQRFINCKQTQKIGQKLGLETHYKDIFYGCASAIYGRKI